MVKLTKKIKVFLFVAGLTPVYEAKAIDWSGKVGIGPSFGFSRSVILSGEGLKDASEFGAGFSINYGITKPVRIGLGIQIKRLGSSLKVLETELNASSFELGAGTFLTIDVISEESSCIYLDLNGGYGYSMLKAQVVAEGVGEETEITGSGLSLGLGIGFETLISNNFGIAFGLGLLEFMTGSAKVPTEKEGGGTIFIEGDINKTNLGIFPSFSISGKLYL